MRFCLHGHFDAVYRTLQRYKALNGHLKIPIEFIVPATENWEKEMWGLLLGYKALGIKDKGYYINGDDRKRQMLVDLGFEFNSLFHLVYRTLQRYKALNGHLKIPIRTNKVQR